MTVLYGGGRSGGKMKALADAVDSGVIDDKAYITTTRRCKMCGTRHVIEMPIKGYLEWTRGAMIQDALPELTPDQRELLISSICGTCYDKILSD